MQQDNIPKHTSCFTTEWFQVHITWYWKVMSWTGQVKVLTSIQQKCWVSCSCEDIHRHFRAAAVLHRAKLKFLHAPVCSTDKQLLEIFIRWSNAMVHQGLLNCLLKAGWLMVGMVLKLRPASKTKLLANNYHWKIYQHAKKAFVFHHSVPCLAEL